MVALMDVKRVVRLDYETVVHLVVGLVDTTVVPMG